MDYDVFISCKSEDYKYAEEVYDFLKSEGVNAFLASRELRRMGESEYRKSISKALQSTYHIIVFASKAEYIVSTWVEYEWDMFVNAKLKGFKEGQIMTILKNVDTNDIPMDLWKYESFTFENYKEKLLSYVETPAFLARKEEEKKRAQELAEVQKKKEKEEKEKQIVKEKLIQLAKEYSTKISALSTDIKEMEAKMLSIGITHRICPVCQSQVALTHNYCPSCGWSISPIEGIEGVEYLVNNDPQQIELVKNKKIDDSIIAQKDEEIKKIKEELNSVRESLTKEIEEHKNNLERIQKEHNEKTIAENSSSSLIKKYKLEKLLTIHNANDVYMLLRRFCSSNFIKVGCSCLDAGLDIESLRKTLKCIYGIDVLTYDTRGSVWTLADKIWKENQRTFSNYNNAHK